MLTVRHWLDPRRKRSSSSLRSESSMSIMTPPDNLTFGNLVKLVSNDDGFKDWVAEAKEDLESRPRSTPNIHRPTIHVPSSPPSHLEIRLVEPTPVPSRVGSLGGSMNPTPNGYLNSTNTQMTRAPPLDEVEEQELSSGSISTSSQKKNVNKGKGKATATGSGNANAHGNGNGKGKGKGKFFVQSSPSRASVSDSSPVTSASLVITQEIPAGQSAAVQSSPAKPSPLSPQQPQQQIAMRRSSGSSTGAAKKKRHVSLSTMKGKYQAEKRKAAAALEAKEAREEDGGWEDDEEDLDEWSDDEDKSSMTAASPKEIPPPAPTPLVRMSKKQREAAKAERAQIEAELDAQRKREMFAKQQIFGQPRGLLSQALQSGGSLVDLQAAGEREQSPPIHSASTSANSRPHKTINHAHTHGHSPGPSLLRSKSAVALPVQTGISVTVSNPLSRPVTSNQESTGPPTNTTTTTTTATTTAATSHSNGNSNGISNGNSNSKTRPPALANRARILPPSEEQLETTDEESQDDTLANENTKQKLDQLLQRKEAAKVAKSKGINSIGSGLEATNRTSVAPVAMASSPTTDRRAMITRELSESLRKSESFSNPTMSNKSWKLISDLILERQKSSTSLSTYRHAPAHHPDPNQPRPNVLGRGLLRPMTRTETSSPTGQLNRAKTSVNLHRPQSSANLTISPGEQPPPMTRSNTLAGDGDNDWEARRAEVIRRSLADDTGYRSHGW